MDPFYGKKYDLEKHPHFHESGDSPKGQKYVCKSEILNYGAKYKTTKPAS